MHISNKKCLNVYLNSIMIVCVKLYCELLPNDLFTGQHNIELHERRNAKVAFVRFGMGVTCGW